jgi:hypothetical protein
MTKEIKTKEEEVRDFVKRHHNTTFDQYVDYPSPIYTVFWEGEKYCSGIGGDSETIVKDILNNELLKLEIWFPEQSWKSNFYDVVYENQYLGIHYNEFENLERKINEYRANNPQTGRIKV